MDVQHVECLCISLRSPLALETDALGIYSKYLALNATNPVGVTDEIRQRVEGTEFGGI